MKLSNKIKTLLLCLIMAISSLALFACTQEAGDPTVIPDTPLNVKDYVDGTNNDYKVCGDITVDGIVTEEEWAGQSKFIINPEIGGIPHNIEASAKYTEEGFAIYWKVLGAPAFYNSGRDNHNNSAVEMYIASGDALSANDNSYEIPMLPNGIYSASKYIKAGGVSSYGYKSYSAEIFLAGQIDGELNDPTNNGFIIEAVIPWYLLDASKDNLPDYVCIDGAIINVTSEVGSRNAWYSIASNNRVDYGWSSPQGWYKFSANGWEDDSEFGYFKVNKFTKGVTVTDDKDVDVDWKWNGGMKNVDVTETITGDFYQEVTVFKPSLYDSSVAKYENQPYADGKIDCGLMGLSLRRKGGSGDLQVAGHFENTDPNKLWRVRFQGAGWNNTALTEQQLANFSNPEKGLRIGMLNIGKMIYAYIENDNGVMTKFAEYDMSKRDNGFTADCEKIVGLATLAPGMARDYVLYSGDDMDVIPYVINGGEALANGSVSVDGTIKDGAVIEVIPNDGYDVELFKVNGQEINSVFYDVPAMSAPILNIEVKFVQSTITKNPVALTIKGAIVGETAELVSGRVSFDGANSAVGKVVDGVINVKLADGEYSVSVPGYFPQTITVTNGVASTTELVLVKSIFELNNPNWTISSNQDGYSVASVISDKYHLSAVKFIDLDFDGKDKYGIAFDYTFTGSLSSASKYFPFFNFKLENGQEQDMQMCCWSTNVILKHFQGNVNYGTIVSGGGNFSVDLRMVVSGSTYSLYKRAGNSLVAIKEGLDFGSNIKEVTICYCNDYSTETPEVWSFKNIKVSNLQPVDVTIADCDNATVTVANDKVSFGQKVVVSVAPKAASNDEIYVVEKITINGQDCDFTLDNGVVKAEYTLLDRTATGVNVVVTVRKSSIVTITSTVKTGYAFDVANLTAVQDDTVITFTGSQTYTATVKDGSITIDLPEGSYVVSMDGAVNVAINVTSDGFTDLILPLPLINLNDTIPGGDTSGKANQLVTGYSAETGYTITNKENGSQYQAFYKTCDYSNGVKIDLTFTVDGLTGTSQLYPAIYVSGVDGDGKETRTEMQFCIWNGSYTVKQGKHNNQVTGMSSHVSGSGIKQNYTIYVQFNGGNVEIVLKQGDTSIATVNYANTSNKSASDWKYLTSITEIGVGFMNGTQGNTTWSFSNIAISPIA